MEKLQRLTRQERVSGIAKQRSFAFGPVLYPLHIKERPGLDRFGVDELQQCPHRGREILIGL